jgi:hypothetical protein
MMGVTVLTLVGTIVATWAANVLVGLLRRGWRVKVSRRELSVTRTRQGPPPTAVSDWLREFLASKEARDVARARIAKLTARFARAQARRAGAKPPRTDVPSWAVVLFTRKDADRYAAEWRSHLDELVKAGLWKEARNHRRGLAWRALLLGLELRAKQLLRRTPAR